MHIALYSPAWPFGYPNGIVSYVHYLRGGLEQLGHRVTIITSKIVGPVDDAHVHCIELSIQDKLRLRLARLLGRTLHPSFWVASAIASKVMDVHATQTIDVFEIEESFGWFADIARKVPFPVVAKLHGPAFITQTLQSKPPADIHERMAQEAAALKSHAYLCSPSHDTLKQAQETIGIAAPFSEVLVNPVQCDIPASLRWNHDDKHADKLLFVGRFDAHKGGDIVLLAFKKILAARSHARLMFVGPNTGHVEESGSLYTMDAFLDRHFNRIERERITVTGPLKADTIGNLRVQSAVTIVASRWENQPNTVLEAMVQGCPVVATGTAGIPEVITHDVDGLLCRNADPDDMASACLRILESPELAMRLGTAAHLRSVAKHHPLAVAHANIAFYERVIAAAGAGRTRH